MSTHSSAMRPCDERAPSLVAASLFTRYVEVQRAAGRTLAEIGASLGVSQPAVSDWINGRKRVPRTVLILAELLMRQDAGRWPL